MQDAPSSASRDGSGAPEAAAAGGGGEATAADGRAAGAAERGWAARRVGCLAPPLRCRDRMCGGRRAAGLAGWEAGRSSSGFRQPFPAGPSARSPSRARSQQNHPQRTAQEPTTRTSFVRALLTQRGSTVSSWGHAGVYLTWPARSWRLSAGTVARNRPERPCTRRGRVGSLVGAVVLGRVALQDSDFARRGFGEVGTCTCKESTRFGVGK